MAQKLNILQFANKPPYPPKDGGAIGINNVSHEILMQGHYLKLLSVNTHKHFVDIHKLEEEYINKTNIEFQMIDTRLKPTAALFNLFSKRSYHIVRFFDAKLAHKLIEILQKTQFDIIIVESIFLKDYMPILRKYSNAKIILRAPNIEYLIWERLAEEEKNPLKKGYLTILAQRLKKEEVNAFKLFDAIFAVTLKDIEFIQKHAPEKTCTFIPTGLDVCKRLEKITTTELPLSISHIGALDWRPNQEGLEWFIEKIWPQLRERFPKLKFHIAGRRPEKWVYKINDPNIILHGEVANATEFITSHDIMLVPLFSGSGMRVKIIEGMMLGRAIVSTSIGCEGIICQSGKDLLIADDEDRYLSQLEALLKDTELLHNIQKQAVISAKNHYSEEKISQKLQFFLEEVIKKGHN